MAQCRDEEAAMTDAHRGQYTSKRSCYDLAPPGDHGAWRFGRIGLDVVTRDEGDAYTFEALWMCKPVAPADRHAAAAP